jgi:putative transcriptional regulator
LRKGTGLRTFPAMSPLQLRLRELREARGLTQAQLADAAGVRRATISDLENGATRQDTLDLIDRLCAALKVEPGELIVREKKGRR